MAGGVRVVVSGVEMEVGIRMNLGRIEGFDFWRWGLVRVFVCV